MIKLSVVYALQDKENINTVIARFLPLDIPICDWEMILVSKTKISYTPEEKVKEKLRKMRCKRLYVLETKQQHQLSSIFQDALGVSSTEAPNILICGATKSFHTSLLYDTTILLKHVGGLVQILYNYRTLTAKKTFCQNRNFFQQYGLFLGDISG